MSSSPNLLDKDNDNNGPCQDSVAGNQNSSQSFDTLENGLTKDPLTNEAVHAY